MDITNLDDIDCGWGEKAYVWVRPSKGRTWDEIFRTHNKYDNNDWQPAAVTGFTDPGDRDWYGTANDTRRVTLLGSPYGHLVSDFEFGDQLDQIPEPECSGEIDRNM